MACFRVWALRMLYFQKSILCLKYLSVAKIYSDRSTRSAQTWKHAIKKNSGSASIEAMLVVPIFLFAMLAFIYINNIIVAKTVIYQAAAKTSEYMAEYAYFTRDMSTAARDASSIAICHEKFNEYIDDKELVDRYVSGDVTFLGSSFPNDDNDVVLKFSYMININIPFICNLSKVYTDTITEKAYLGYRSEDAIHIDTSDSYVYVAENGTVYHLYRNCRYLKIDVTVTGKQNAISKGYSPCEFCGSMAGANVFISEGGGRYHSTRSCSRLVRTVYRKKLSEVGGMPKCSVCH